MSSALTYPLGIEYRTPRPRGENTLAGIILGALIGSLLTETPTGGVAGGAVGGALSNGPLPLDAAIRSHFDKNNLSLVGFYRLGPRAAKVLFSYHNQYWTLISRAPENASWTLEALDDWLYGDIVEEQLPKKIRDINAHLG